MAITITGGKYAVASLNAVGTTTVTVGTTPFVSGDFAVARRVDLFGPAPQQLTNGEFSSDTAWTKGAGVTISGGVANCTSAALIVAQVSSMVSGTQYRCTLDYTKTSGTNLRVCNSLDGSANILNVTAASGTSGTIEFLFTPTNANISIAADAATFSGTIDNFSVREVTTLKGTAYVRQWNSTSQLQLESEFFNPDNGSTVAQAVGDLVLVSKNLADVIQTGIALSNGIYTISDTITFGRIDNQLSASFHDETATVVNTVSTLRSLCYTVAGGLIGFGHLQSYVDRSWYGGCGFSFTYNNTLTSFVASSTAARMWLIGGSHKGQGAAPCYLAAGQNSAGASFGTDWSRFWALDVQFDATDVISKNQGGNWTTGANHILENCSYVGVGTNLILLRFANGTVNGGQFKLLRNSTAPISVFGGEGASTFEIGAPPGQRSVILDIGPNALWRCALTTVQTVNCTNLISTNYALGTGVNPESSGNASGTKNVYFEENYTNLQTGSALGAIRDSDFTLDDSATSAGAIEALRVFHSTGTGLSLGAQRGPWTYRIRRYGYNELEGAIAESSYSLGTAGTAFDVAFGGLVNQIARASLTDSEATAAAYTGITVTDRGASPVTWNGKAYSIDIVVDLTVAPSRTAAQVFAHVKAKIASTSPWGGKDAGLLWHVLVEEDGDDYVTQRGKSGGAGAALKGVRVVDQAGNPLPGFVGMVADDGTTYVPPTADVRGLAFTGLVAGSFVRIVQDSDLSQKFVDTNSATSETWSESASGSLAVSYVVLRAGYEPIGPVSVTVTGAVSGGVISIPIVQVQARWYQASSGLTINTNAFANAATKLFGLTTGSTLQNFASYLLEQWIALGGTGGAFANKPWPLQANGPNSFTWLAGWEADLTTYPNTIANLSQDGMRYVSAASAVTAIWAAIQSVNVSAGMRVRFQQSDGGTTQQAAITSGNIDELVQVYGDPSHGDFDRRGYLVTKVQEQGFDQAEVDVVGQYGNLEDQLYVVGLAPTANGVATGDPGITGVTITDHAGSPETWNGGPISITITDSGANSGENILRWLRYYFETGGTFQSKDAFNWHDLVQKNGAKYKTVRGKIYGDTGATLKGVRVLRGSDPHPDFDLFTFDDGTTYSPPVVAAISITGLVNAGAVPTRLQIINKSAETSVAWQATTAYSLGAMRLRTTGQGTENTAGLYFRATTAGTSGGTEPVWNTTVGGTTTDGTVIWTTYAVLFYDADPAATSYSGTYTEGNQFKAGETVEVRFAEMNAGTSFKRGHSTTIASSAGFSFSMTLDIDDVFASNALDGSSYETTFSPNFADDYIVMDTNADFSGKAAYAYFCYTLTSSNGMYQFWDGVTALDAGNYRIETDILDLYFDESAGFVKQTDDVRIFRKDGTRPALDPTTGGNGIEINWRVPVSVVSTGGSALTPSESAHLLGLSNAPSAATVATSVLSAATATPIHADAKTMNGATIIGTGSVADPWRGSGVPAP